jgi:Metal binding domain of Ada
MPLPTAMIAADYGTASPAQNSTARIGVLAIEIWLRLGFEIEQQNEAMTTTVQADKEITGTAFATDEQRWAAVQSRNPLADGDFVYAVKTTGV